MYMQDQTSRRRIRKAPSRHVSSRSRRDVSRRGALSQLLDVAVRPDAQLCFLLAAGVLLGGGGLGAASLNFLIQLVALLILAVNGPRVIEAIRAAPRLFSVLFAATVLLPLLQLVPLPASIWAHLPGREIVTQSLSLVGAQDQSAPVSLAIYRTAIAASALIPAFAAIVLAVNLNGAQARRVLGCVAVLGGVNVLFGLVQLSTANRVGNFYANARPDQLYGTFANHNSTGLFLCLSLVALVAAFIARPVDRVLARLMPVVAGALFLVVAVVLTQSRSSMGITALALIVLVFPFFRVLRVPLAKLPRKALVAIAGAVLLLAAVLGAIGTSTIGNSLGRFSSLEDARALIWEDAFSAAGRYWPVGAGMGSFDEVFQVDESLENIRSGRARRAHNDYLEIAVEAGVFGLGLVACWMLWFVVRIWKGRREPDAALRLGAGGVLACIALQSAVDYPLRNMAMICVATVMAGLLARPASVLEDSPSRIRRSRREMVPGVSGGPVWQSEQRTVSEPGQDIPA